MPPTPTPRRRRPRPVSPLDTAASTGMIVNPIGTYIPRPETAVYGPQGTYGQSLPQVNVAPAGPGYRPNVPGAVPLVQALQRDQPAYGGSYLPSVVTPSQLLDVLRRPTAAYSNVPNPYYRAPQPVTASPGPVQPQTPQALEAAARRTSQRTSGGATPQAMENLAYRIASGEAINLPASQRDALERMLTGSLPSGQFRDAQGEAQQGATPFGTNAQGQRLDIEGNVWEPETAERDIYGGRFIQKGEVRWERNARGRLVKVQYLGGGKKKIVKGGRGQSRPRPSAAPGAPEVQQTTEGFTGTYGLVSFNTSTG